MGTSMDDLVEWLRAQLDVDAASEWHEDSCAAVRFGVGNLGCDCAADARVLREVEAKRLILDEHSAATDHDSKGEWPICATCRAEPPDDDRASWSAYYPCKTLRLLALPYSDRPGNREEWRP